MRAKATPVGFEQRLLVRSRAAGLARGDRVVIGFSGGRDSLALAAGLRRSRDALGIDLLLVHVDHRLRAGSGEEATRAEDLARRLGLNFRAIGASPSPIEIHPHVGVEEAARRERYRLLTAAAEEVGARAVATGHHQQDQAETVLLHLLRGSGVHGASGMREWSEAIPSPGPERDISREIAIEAASQGGDSGRRQPSLWRPLLREPRSAIDAYVGLIGLPWIEDPTNTDLALRRNSLRHEIIPMVEARFPGATAALARYADLAAADDDLLEQVAQAAMEGEVDPGGRLRVARLGEQHLGTQRRILRRWLAHATGSREFSAERIDAVLELAHSGRGGQIVEAGGGWTVRLRQGMLSAWRPGDGARGEP